MQYFPLFVDTNKLSVLIVGAGDVATRKLDLLARTEAQIDVIAPEVAEDIRAYAARGRVSLIERKIQEQDLQGYELVYLATADEQLNSQLAVLAKQRGIWANVVDNPAFCQFITPSIVDRGRLTVAISTSGAAPVFARTIRAKLETMLPQSLSPLFDFVAQKRGEVQQRLTNGKDRRLFWERFFTLNQDKFDEHTTSHYQASFEQYAASGELIILDAATSADLLPLAAMPILQRVDNVYCDTELPLALMELVRRDAGRHQMLLKSQISQNVEHGERMLLILPSNAIEEFVAHFPNAKHIRPGKL
ncbi:bifunctional precorrin-2 dehydrogenase/sirohydrochlorin ferrochelatase [Shewanella maritima]|uniref:precorrin-2 dehydrogenase/sirohydrochlorin ferrochelatase family protein n=1 Tax=Shewanella maritima TaxID=2520507 RepID=UPI0037359B30